MIYGIGIDIVSLEKIGSICCQHKNLLKNNLFSEKELCDVGISDSVKKLTNVQLSLLASKFAAKEAAVKAIQLPIDVSFNWSDIIVIGKDNISIEMNGNIKKFMKQKGILRLSGSSSITNSYSIAFIIGESK